MAQPNEKTKPVHEVRYGRIRAAVWENETSSGTRHNVTITRLYRDGEQWHNSTSFGRDDLPLVAKVADDAHSWIFAESQRTRQNATQNGSSQEHDEEAPF